MKTITKIALWSLVALIAAGFTACKTDDPFSDLNENSLENTAWSLEKQETYNSTTEGWDTRHTYSDIDPSSLKHFLNGKRELIDKTFDYSIDVEKKEFIQGGGRFPIVELTANKFVYMTESKNSRSTYKRIPNMQSAKLYGKWQITGLQEYNVSTEQWNNGSFASGYFIEFNENGTGFNSLNDNCKYTITGNILNIECIYGRSFVVELTDDKLVFIHRYKGTGTKYIRETYKKRK